MARKAHNRFATRAPRPARVDRGGIGALGVEALGPMKGALPSPIEALFRRHPALGGFSIRGLDEVPDNCPRGRDGDSGLFVGDVGVSPALAEEEFRDVVDDIIVAVAEMLSERPDAADSLRGRTFARALH